MRIRMDVDKILGINVRLDIWFLSVVVTLLSLGSASGEDALKLFDLAYSCLLIFPCEPDQPRSKIGHESRVSEPLRRNVES